MESASLHAIDGRFSGYLLAIVIGIDDSLVLVLPVDEVQVVFAVGVEFDRPV